MINKELYDDYIQALLKGDRQYCFELVKDLLDKDISIYDLYIHLFQSSLYHVGHLWETNKISVATEHMATSITEGLLSLTYPKIFSADHKGKKAVISCIANEYHQIGGKMVADIFELNGWDGYFLGANTPLNELMEMVKDKQPDMLALSLSIYFNMQSLHDVIGKIKEVYPELKVIVGGQAFRWGGQDIGSKFKNVRYVPTINDLEKMLVKND
ncbi:cobalamin B12-binding domain-containing protein [Desulfonatronovibrio magnus]|uniref:cobalamin B12-binding domain-containing protein n=1 Tax=Desulfonatronovibrio magnus TaxID=698827 RepID=UPI0005EB60E1|nr:cobalamin-dependent protein [Desulfonatronovibrio magnus]RQD66762.1 MAG: cobalamin-binding protein [Desulfonatronovibrio sp. MSAO_Bac4]